MSAIRVSYRAWIFGVLLTCLSCRKPPAEGIEQPRFAIEEPLDKRNDRGPLRHWKVLPGSHGTTDIPYSSFTEISSKARGPNVPNQIHIEFWPEDDKVKLRISAVMEGYDYRKHVPATHYQELGFHKARLNESVKLKELEKAGFRPFTLKIVPFKPPPRSHPQLVNHTSSLSAEFGEDEWDDYVIKLKNISPHTIRAYAVGGKYDSQVVIAPFLAGKTQPVLWSVDRDAGAPIEVLALLLAGGPYEGDASIAAWLRAHVIAADIEKRRIVEAVKPVMENPDLDPDGKRVRIRQIVGKLSIDPDRAATKAILAGLPFSELNPQSLNAARNGMRNAKDGALAALTDPDLNNWWKNMQTDEGN